MGPFSVLCQSQRLEFDADLIDTKRNTRTCLYIFLSSYHFRSCTIPSIRSPCLPYNRLTCAKRLLILVCIFLFHSKINLISSRRRAICLAFLLLACASVPGLELNSSGTPCNCNWITSGVVKWLIRAKDCSAVRFPSKSHSGGRNKTTLTGR